MLDRLRQLQLPSWTWLHRMTAALFLALLLLGQQAWFPWLRGSPTATRVFQAVPIVDPLSGLEVIVAARGGSQTLIVGMAATLLLAFVAGRVFCGWICPLGLLLDLNAAIRATVARLLASRGMRLPSYWLPISLKYWLLVFFLGVSVVASIPTFTTVSPINLVLISASAAPILGLVAIGCLAALEYVAPRAFCRAICPLGAFHSLVGSRARLRIWVHPSGEQLACGQCSGRCPMGIAVMEDHVFAGDSSVANRECTRCGTCADHCSGRMLHLGVRQPPAKDHLPACSAPENVAVEDNSRGHRQH